MRSFTLLSALFAAVVSAVTTPVGQPDGNPIFTPQLGELVQAGKPFTITWQPTTTGTVSLLLLRGPSSNVVPIGAPIAEGIANSGSFVWTPGPELEPDTLRYGIQLIVDATGQYQYSVQFGVANPDYTTITTSAASIESTTIVTPTEVVSSTTSAEPTTTEIEEETTTSTTEEPTTTTIATTTTTSTEVEEETTTSIPTPTEVETTTSTIEIISTTLVTTTKVPVSTGNYTTHLPPSNTSAIIPPAVTDDDNSAGRLFSSFGMAVVAFAVAGLTIF